VPPVALVTARDARDVDEDLPPLVDALAAIGVEADVVVWDDVSVGWESYRLVVLRSTWDYVEAHDDFLAWAARVAVVTALANPVEVVAWNTDKKYLRDLEEAGVPVAPTAWFSPGAPLPDTDALGAVAGGADVVVKPGVSAGSRNTARYAPSRSDLARAAAHVARLVAAGRDVLVQPYVTGIDHEGETAVVYIDGALSHGLRKGPMLERGERHVHGLFAVEDMGARDPTSAQAAVAEAALRAATALAGATGPLLYARVDLVPDAAGNPMVLELELTEPSLFHAYAPESAARFAAAIARRLG
jgi:O-ureido-D-serine cyclo-ligase